MAVTDVHDLYGLPLDRFVAERGALAKALRAEGHREQAAMVAGRRKPSLAAWAVNQLVRTQGPAISSLFEAGDGLQRTQSELLAGRGDARELREAGERERAVVDELAEVSRGLLSADGHELTQATLDRVSATLDAAALDEEARDQVREGCLERELRRAGFGTTGALITSTGTGQGGAEASRRAGQSSPGKPSAPEPAGTAKGEAKRGAQARRAERQRAERQRGEREETERRQAAREQAARLKAARKAEADARRSASRAARELETAQQRHDRAATALRAAQDALDAAREHAEEATRGHRHAQESLDTLTPESAA